MKPKGTGFLVLIVPVVDGEVNKPAWRRVI